MKKSVLTPYTKPSLNQKPDSLQIPKCESFQQFFSLKNSKRKKRNSQLTSSIMIDQSLQFQGSVRSQVAFGTSSEKITINDALTSVTDSSSNGERSIRFKKSTIRQKINRIQSRSKQHTSKLVSPFKKITNLPRPPVINLPKPKVQSFQKPNKKKWCIQDFLIIRKIGQGSYSEVFLAVQIQTSFVCSLKIIRKQSIKQQNLLHVVIRQLKIHHYLNHPNIVNLYGQFDDQKYLYLICQYCTDGDLHKNLKNKNRLGEQFQLEEASQIVKQICQAVATMHKDDLMHRDIKPENVFLTMGNVVKLGDFGWSVYFGDHGLRNTQCGTPLYLAPELVQQNEYTETVDIWAIGVLTYELLAGQCPFKIRCAKDLAKIVNQNIKFEYIDNQIARDFVMRLLQRDVKLRMQIEDVLQHPFLRLEEND